jgi:DNA-binding transcriptional MerR regulator
MKRIGQNGGGSSRRRDSVFSGSTYLTVLYTRGYNTVMKQSREAIWTIDELRGAVEAALAEGYGGPPNGRVRGVPDERTIRYYTTLGLLDRASEMRGRTALYGRRHLLQLVAIKKLQARGQTLAEIQRALLGQTDATLARLAGVNGGDVLGRAAAAPARPPRAFWRQRPESTPESPPELAEESAYSERKTAARAESCGAAGDTHQVLQGVELTANVTLLLAAARTLATEDLRELRAAAHPLIDLLVRLQIIPPRAQGDSK